MKTIRQLLLLTVALSAVSIYSCRKTHNNSNALTSLPKYEKRWNITSAARPALPTLASKPSSPSGIEFLINSYVISFSDGTVQVGQYAVTNDTTLVLDSVGTIHITLLTSSNFSFTVTPLDNSAPLTFTADAADASGDFTSPADIAFVTTVWTVDSTKFYLPVDSSKFNYDSSIAAYASFSEYGTYLSRSVYADGHQVYKTNSWLWSNDQSSEFCYGNWTGQSITNCTGLESAEIISYPAPYTKLVVEQTDPSDPVCFYLSKH